MENLEEQAHHVHFEESSDTVKTNQIVIKQKQDSVEIQLGFLQVHHLYEIQVKMPKSFLPKTLRFNLIILKVHRGDENVLVPSHR